MQADDEGRDGYNDEQSGKRAGRFSTLSAVLSDIAALRYDYKYEHGKLHIGAQYILTESFYLRLFISFNDWSAINKK